MPDTDVHQPRPGVIEAFYGEPWDWEARRDAVPFLAGAGYGFYIYAPKSDAGLRRNWRRGPDDATAVKLAALGRQCREAGLAFGIGISPFEVWRGDRATARADLKSAIARLNDVGPDMLCLLFDDMTADMPDLAETQAALTGEIAAAATASRLLFCPTIYSFDPIVTAAMPDARTYLRDIGGMIDPDIAMFWTGPEVRSTAYPADHLSEVANLLRRKPFLWDNHLANDGAESSDFLPLATSQSREGLVNDLTAGCAINPMNQPCLARVPLHAIATGATLEESCIAVCGAGAGAALARDIPLLQKTGRAALSPAQRAVLAETYRRFANVPAAAELAGWLDGAWPWDPECLTG